MKSRDSSTSSRTALIVGVAPRVRAQLDDALRADRDEELGIGDESEHLARVDLEQLLGRRRPRERAGCSRPGSP